MPVLLITLLSNVGSAAKGLFQTVKSNPVLLYAFAAVCLAVIVWKNGYDHAMKTEEAKIAAMQKTAIEDARKQDATAATHIDILRSDEDARMASQIADQQKQLAAYEAYIASLKTQSKQVVVKVPPAKKGEKPREIHHTVTNACDIDDAFLHAAGVVQH